MYTLEKLELMSGQDSMVSQGHRQSGSRLAVFLAGEHPPKEIKRVSSVKVGKQVLILGRGLTDYLHTSPVQEVLEKGKNWIKFRTRTSVYLLTKE